MLNHRHRPIVYAVMAVAAVWLLASAGWIISRHSKVTAEKVTAYLREVDLSQLSGDTRARALRELARMMASLPVAERRRARLDGQWGQWFNGMTEQEKSQFIEATMPSGFRQMLASFEQLPEEKRREAINRSMRELKKAREEMDANGAAPLASDGATNRPPELSSELQQKVVQLGLKSFYSESSAQTKAELAPLLEEMQRAMESGALFRAEPR